jgi:hypothetical protein
MFKVEEVTFDVLGEKFDRLRSLFFSKEEHLAAAKEAVAEDSEGWKKRIKERLAANRASSIKDPVLQQRVLDLLQLKNLEEASVTGYYEEKSPNDLVVNLAVRAKAPSFVFRLLFEDNITALIQVRAERRDTGSTVTVKYVGRQVLGVIGCLVVIVAFGACILPGLVCLYFISHINSTWSAMTEAVAQAIQESYSEA